jgi:hypothetical protein
MVNAGHDLNSLPRFHRDELRTIGRGVVEDQSFIGKSKRIRQVGHGARATTQLILVRHIVPTKKHSPLNALHVDGYIRVATKMKARP